MTSPNFIIASSALNNQGIWICGADYMLDNLVTKISDAAQQMIDVIDGKGLFSFESKPEHFTTVTFDFESALGDLSMRLRNPIWSVSTQNIDTSQVDFNKNKVVPLPPEFEKPCTDLYSGQLPKMMFFADGTFKLIKT